MPKSRNNNTDWVARIPYIKDMMRFMTDRQIADQYNVKTKTIKDVRRRHGLARPGEKMNLKPERTPKQIAKTQSWDFSWQNLNV